MVATVPAEGLSELLVQAWRLVAPKRLVKESVSKYGKDTLNRKLGTLVFEKVYGSVPELYQQGATALVAQGVPSVETIREVQSALDARAAQLNLDFSNHIGASGLRI